MGITHHGSVDKAVQGLAVAGRPGEWMFVEVCDWWWCLYYPELISMRWGLR